jgi:hypothetical protein
MDLTEAAIKNEFREALWQDCGPKWRWREFADDAIGFAPLLCISTEDVYFLIGSL